MTIHSRLTRAEAEAANQKPKRNLPWFFLYTEDGAQYWTELQTGEGGHHLAGTEYLEEDFHGLRLGHHLHICDLRVARWQDVLPILAQCIEAEAEPAD